MSVKHTIHIKGGRRAGARMEAAFEELAKVSREHLRKESEVIKMHILYGTRAEPAGVGEVLEAMPRKNKDGSITYSVVNMKGN